MKKFLWLTGNQTEFQVFTRHCWHHGISRTGIRFHFCNISHHFLFIFSLFIKIWIVYFSENFLFLIFSLLWLIENDDVTMCPKPIGSDYYFSQYSCTLESIITNRTKVAYFWLLENASYRNLWIITYDS